jgi:hypothetical protein
MRQHHSRAPRPLHRRGSLSDRPPSAPRPVPQGDDIQVQRTPRSGPQVAAERLSSRHVRDRDAGIRAPGAPPTGRATGRATTRRTLPAPGGRPRTARTIAGAPFFRATCRIRRPRGIPSALQREDTMANRKTARIPAARPPAGKSNATLTHERISSDLEAFRKAGGRIEVLGNTRVLTKVDAPEDKKD